MKYRFTLLALMAVSATPLVAQGGGAAGGMRQGGGQGGPGRGMMANINTAALDQLDTWFKFTADQKAKVQTVVTVRDSVVTPMNAYRMQLVQQAMAAGGGGDAGGRRGGGGFPQLPADSQTKLDAAQTKFRESLRSVLTGPQLPVFDSLVQAAAAGRGGMGGAARGGRGGGGRAGGGGGGI